MCCFGSWCFIRAPKVIQRVREKERKEVGREEGRQGREGEEKARSQSGPGASLHLLTSRLPSEPWLCPRV